MATRRSEPSRNRPTEDGRAIIPLSANSRISRGNIVGVQVQPQIRAMRSRWPDYRIDLGTLVQARNAIVKSEPLDFWIDQKANQIRLDSIPRGKKRRNSGDRHLHLRTILDSGHRIPADWNFQRSYSLPQNRRVVVRSLGSQWKPQLRILIRVWSAIKGYRRTPNLTSGHAAHS